MVSLFSRRLIPVLFIFLFLFQFVSTLSAHTGGEPQIINESVGPFRVSVWSLPTPLVPGDSNFVVFVAEETGDESQRANTPILDADIELLVTPLSGGDQILIIPDHDTAVNKLFYESYFQIPTIGNYRADLTVTADGQRGQTSFEFEVTRPSVEISWQLYGNICVFLLVALWFRKQLTLDREQI